MVIWSYVDDTCSYDDNADINNNYIIARSTSQLCYKSCWSIYYANYEKLCHKDQSHTEATAAKEVTTI